MAAAIVLSHHKYSDNGSVLHLYTAEQGRVQYVVYGNKYKGVLRPLSIIDFTAKKRNNAPAQMGVISSVSLTYIPQRISTDVQRQCVALFIAEILLYTLRHPLCDSVLYEWITNIILRLDQADDIRDLHLEFLIDFAIHLGIGIDEDEHPDWFIAPQTRLERQKRLQQLTEYYQEHIEDFRHPKSLDVLMEVFDY